MNILIKLFIFIILIASFPILSEASVYNFGNPVSLEFAHDITGNTVFTGQNSHQFLVVNGNATNGTISACDFIDSTGAYMYSCANLLTSGVSIKKAAADQSRTDQVFFVDSSGNIGRFLTTSGVIDYSLGWFDSGFVGNCALGGNCNPMYKIGVLSIVNNKIGMVTDSSGNLYVANSLEIKKFNPSVDYTSSSFYTFPCPGAACTLASVVQSLQIDNQSQMHAILGTNDCAKGVLSSAGVLIYGDPELASSNLGATNLCEEVLDASGNQSTNFTAVYRSSADPTKVYVSHYANATGLETDYPCGTHQCVGITTMGGMLYMSGRLFIANPGGNNITTFVTNHTGISQTTAVGAGASLIYTSATVNSLYPTYYNNTPFQIVYDLAYQATATQKNIIGHRIDLIDPNSAAIQTYNIVPSCDSIGFLDLLLSSNPLFNCTASKTFSFTTATQWQNGTFSAKLYEVNSSTGASVLLDSDSFTVLNQTKPSTGIAPGGSGSQPNEPVSASAIVDLLSNNTFWALIFTVGFIVTAGVFAGKSKSNPIMPMLMVGFLSIAVFTMLGWLPLWLLFCIILIVIVGFAWQQSRNMNVGSQ